MSPTPGQQISRIKNHDFKIIMLHNNSRINTSKIKQRFSPSALAKNSSKKLNSYHQMIAECIARKPTVKLERIDENLINTLTTGDKVMADNSEKAGNREPVNSNRENSDSDNLVCVISDVRGDAIDIYDTNTSKHLNINKFLPNNQEVSTSSAFKSEEKFEINQCFVNLLETVETMADDKHPNVDGLSQNITPNNYVFEFSSKDSEDLSESELVIDTAEIKIRDFNIKEENDSSNDMDVHPFSKFSKIVSENKKSVDSSEENDAQVRLFSVKSPFPENEEILSEHKVPKLIIKQSRLPSTDIRAENVKCPGKFDIMHESLSTVNSQNREDKVFRGESSSKISSEDYKNSSKSFKRRKYGEGRLKNFGSLLDYAILIQPLSTSSIFPFFQAKICTRSDPYFVLTHTLSRYGYFEKTPTEKKLSSFIHQKNTMSLCPNFDSHLKHSEDKKKKKTKLVKIARMKYDSFLEESRIASELPGFNWLENKIKNSSHTLGSLSTRLKRCSGGSITFNKTNRQIRHQTDNQTIRLSDNQIDHQTDKDVPGLLEVKENEPNKVKECHIEENNGEIDSTSFMPHNHNGTHETRPSVFTNSNSVLHTLNTQENLKHSAKPNSFRSIEQEGKINSVVREVLHEILDKITFRKDEIDIEIIDVDNQRSIQEDTDKLPKKKREDKSPPISTNTLEDLESVNKTKSSDSGDSKNLHHLLENESHNKIASPKSVDLDTSKSSNEDLYDEIIDVVETDSITGDLKRSYQSSSVAKAPSVQNIPETSIQRPQLPRPISSPATWNMQTMMNDVEKCYFRPSSVDSHSSARNMYTKKMTPVINLAPELKDNSQKLRLNSLYKEQSYFNGKTSEFSPNNVQLSPEINPSKIVRPNCKTPVLNLKENTRTESTPFRPQLRLTNDLNMKISQIMMNEALRNAEIYRRANEYVLIKPKTTTVPLSSTNTVQNLLKQNENNILPSSFITNSTCQTFETPSSPTCNGISAPPLIWDCSNLNPI
ncbi:hypothetical protein GQR58_029151 [Nymphon striatum]|nr:hypothetical protein GQR58_029151 [Nymphon striatum]